MLEECVRCGTRYAPGLAACPHCGALPGETPAAEAGADGGEVAG